MNAHPHTRTRRVIAVAICIGAVLALAGCTDPPASAPPVWALVGNPVVSSTNTTSSITRVNAFGDIVVATAILGQNTSGVTVSAYRSNAWTQLGGQLNTTSNAVLTGMELDPAGHPYVAWTEGGSGYVSHWDGSAWQSVGGPIANIVNEDLFIASGSPLTIGYYQLNGPVPTGRQLIIATWTGSTWTTLAPHVLPFYTTAFPVAVAMTGTTPVVAWQGLQPNGSVWSYVVEQYTDNAWASLGTVFSTNPTGSLGPVSLAAGDGLIGLAWTQSGFVAGPHGAQAVTDSFVDQWTGTAWQTLGGDLGNPVVGALVEGFGHFTAALTTSSTVTVQTWSGSAWVAVGGPANVDVGVAVPTSPVSLSQSVGAFALSWTGQSHPDSTTFLNQIRVSEIPLS
jgi:hypothetical protein